MRKYNYLLALIALSALCISPIIGVASISFNNILDASSADALILWQIRIPRAILAFFVGALLALSGLLFQNIFRNSLMTPFTLGVSSGATLGAALAIFFGFSAAIFGFSIITFFAFFMAFATVALLALFAIKLKSFSNQNLLLIGIALSYFYTAILFIIYYRASVLQVNLIIRFTLGNLDVVGFGELTPIVFFALILLFVSLFFAPELNLLSISEENAKLKGVNVQKVVLILLIAVSLAVGAGVSVAGPIGFVGLIIPHLLKKIFKIQSASLIVTTFLSGGIFLLICDILSRLGSETEIPIGVVTSFFGGPFFIYLIFKNRSLAVH